MSNDYEMDVLRTIVSERFNVEIVKKNNKRDAVTGRKIFSKILNDRGYAPSEIAKYLSKEKPIILHYIEDIEWMIKNLPNTKDDYTYCNEEFVNTVEKTVNEDNKDITILKVRIYELLLERQKLKEKMNSYNRIKEIIRFVDTNTPVGKEYFILKKIRLMFNTIIDYEEQQLE